MEPTALVWLRPRATQRTRPSFICHTRTERSCRGRHSDVTAGSNSAPACVLFGGHALNVASSLFAGIPLQPLSGLCKQDSRLTLAQLTNREPLLNTSRESTVSAGHSHIIMTIREVSISVDEHLSADVV